MIIITTKRRLELAIGQLWAKIKANFASISHTHSINQVNGLSTSLQEIRSLVQPVEKEVINATAVPSTGSVASPVEGNYYFIKPVSCSAGSLYLYDGSSFQSQTPSEDIIYTISDGDDVLIYIWNGSAFVEISSGSMVSNTIYISVSNSSQFWQIVSSNLEQYTDEGQYNVYITYKLGTKHIKEFLTFVVAKTAANKMTQLLSNRYGFRIRSANKIGSSWSFGEWEIDTYSLEGHNHDGVYLKQHQDISGKQDVISDLATIRSGAEAGATALQPNDVPAWAKESAKPTYTAVEVGALPANTAIPSKTSDLINDSGFLTRHQQLKTINGTSLVGTGDIPIQGGGGDEYTLPVASASTLGGVKVGTGLNIDANGVLGVNAVMPEVTVAEVLEVLTAEEDEQSNEEEVQS